MMKFTMNAKGLKTMMEKGMAAINKKATLSTLTRLYFQIDENGILKVWGTDMEHWAEVKTDSVYDTQPGVFGIDVDDIKIISKMSGEITLEDVTTENMEVGKINIKCGKKIVTIPRYQNTDIFLPSMDESEKKIMSVKENWLLETVVNLVTYTSDIDNCNKMMQVFNFNTKSKRIEALDGYRIGIRTLENQAIYETTENPFDTVKIYNKCVPVFKKLMDKKSEKEIGISAVRGGTIVGEHEVIFAGIDEVIEFKHTAYSRTVFGKGAVEAAVYLADKPAGLYDMKDVISAK